MPKWLLCNDATNAFTRIGFSHCGVLSSNLFFMPVYVRNVNHIYQVSDSLVAVDLEINMFMSRMRLVSIYWR